MLKKHLKRWDIFCKIVDNFGDIGVCWRLAKQLAREHDLQVRLLVDDLQIASKLIPTIDFNKNSQIIDYIEIINFNFEVKPADVVIEAFACGLPEKYQNSLTPDTVWVNLEYLSAENWVADFHGRHSKIGDLTRYFYFPGFGENTGGLVREIDAANSYEEIQNHCHSSFPRKRESILSLKAKSNWIPAFAGMTEQGSALSALSLSLFCYHNAPIAKLLNALQTHQHAVVLHVPATSILPQIAAYFGKNEVKAGDVLVRGNLTVNVLPFLSQADYDALLRACDLNFVRGEDSWVRAIWAGKPFIWQPYVQAENTHITKLNAFLEVFYADCAQQQVLQKAHNIWSTGLGDADVFTEFLQYLPEIAAYTAQQSAKQAAQADLATKLVEFCASK